MNNVSVVDRTAVKTCRQTDWDGSDKESLLAMSGIEGVLENRVKHLHRENCAAGSFRTNTKQKCGCSTQCTRTYCTHGENTCAYNIIFVDTSETGMIFFFDNITSEADWIFFSNITSEIDRNFSFFFFTT